MDQESLLRYSRHILLNEIDMVGQENIMQSTIFVIGCGGLGNAVIPYLGAAGVGHLIIADFDVVERSNLQRQLFFTENEIGKSKAASLKARLLEQNPTIKVTLVTERLNYDSLLPLVERADLVIDCTDYFMIRKAINRATVLKKKPLISGAVNQFEGQFALYDSRKDTSPCYACLFDGDEENVEESPCAKHGVYSPLVGMIGLAQVNEALKIVGGFGHASIGQLSIFDAFNFSWSQFKISKRSDCPVCSG